MTIFYFTSTGNSLAVAKRIGVNLISIPQIIDCQKTHYEDDVIGIIFPVYFMTLPKMVLDFLEKVKIQADYIFAIGTCGGMPGGAMADFQKQSIKHGFEIHYANSIVMVDNSLSNTIDKEINLIPKKNIEEMTTKIVTDIQGRKHMNATASPLSRALTYVFRKNIRRILSPKKGKKFTIDDTCTKCGVCGKVCPAQNIIVTDEVHFFEQCENCLGCFHLCPQKAIHLKYEKNSYRWLNPEVTLQEIRNSNNWLAK